mgnify:CR=1 FL=1|tara:strand:- start:17434 stop:18861 length:1428 start_codon:yes stop_codon:yes gene_type:complete
MSAGAIKKDLKAAAKLLNDTFARGELKQHNTYVTITADDLGAGMISGYEKVRKNTDRNLPIIQKRSFQAEGQRQIPIIYNEYKNKRGYTISKRIYKSSNKLAITMPKEVDAFYQFVKNLGVEFVNSKLESKKLAKLSGAREEYEKREKAGTLGKDDTIGKFASVSEVGQMKRGTEKIHTGKTTVGMARLAMMKQWLDKSKFYRGFTSSEEWKTIENKFGKVDLFFTTTGNANLKKATTSINFDLKEGLSVGMKLGDTKDNYSASELRDFAKIAPVLQKKLLKWAKKQAWYDKKGSNTLLQDATLAVRASALHQITKGKRGRLGGKLPKPGNRPKRSITETKKGKNPSIKTTGSYVSPERATRSNAGNQQGASLYTVMAMISEKLPQTVRKNMGAPRLENQTGTFANSVKMTDVIQTPQGYPSFGYTYAKEPYQVYETGSSGNWTTPERDPRKLIDASIREIAAGFALGRFYTRRQ